MENGTTKTPRWSAWQSHGNCNAQDVFARSTQRLCLVFTLAVVSCSAPIATEDTPGDLTFDGASSIEPLAGGKWRVSWAPLTAVSDASFAVFERAENGGKYDFSEPVGRPPNKQSFVTKDLRLVDSRCYTVRALVNDSVIPGADREVCTGHRAFQFAGIASLVPQAKGNYLLSWKPTPFDGENMSFEIRERRKGEDLWRSSGTTVDGFYPSREIAIDEVVCFNVRYIHSGLPTDTNTIEICTDSESSGNFIGISDLKKAAPNDPVGGTIISWEKSVRSDVVGYRIYMGAGFKRQVAEVGRDESEWRATKLTVGATYEFGVRLVTRSGREDGNTKVLRISVDNKVPDVSKVELRGVRTVDPNTGESAVRSILCTADFEDVDRSSGFIFPKVEFKARLATGERPTVLRKRIIGAPIKLDAQGRGTINGTYDIDFSRDRRGNDLYCEVTVFDGLEPSLPKVSKFIFLPDSPAIATGMFISKRAYFDPVNGTTHYYGPNIGGEPAQVIDNADGSKESHTCVITTPADGDVPNTNSLDICEDTSVSIVVKGSRIPDNLFETGKEAELTQFRNKLLYQPGDIGDDYQAFYADTYNRAKVGYWDPDAGDIASVIELRNIFNGTVTSSECIEGVCEINFKMHPNFASGSVYSELGPDGERLQHAQIEYRVRTYVPAEAEGTDLNGTPVDQVGWSNWAAIKIEVTGVDEPPVATGATVLAIEDRVQKVVICNDINSDPECGPPSKVIAINPTPADPLLRYLSGKAFGYFDLEDDPPVRTLVRTVNDAVLPGAWVKPAAGITNPNPATSSDWETVTSATSSATSCDQTAGYCPFQCSRNGKKCYAYFRPNQDFNGKVTLLYDVWTEVNLTTNPDAQFIGKSASERERQTTTSAVLTLDVDPVNDPADVAEIRTSLWKEDEVDDVLHRINFVPVSNYTPDVHVPERVEYFDPDGDLLRRAGDIEIRFLDNGVTKTSYCTISGEIDRLPATNPGVPGVTPALCRTEIGKVKYRPLPPNVNAGAAQPTVFTAAIQWNCDGSGGCFGDLVLPPNYNSVLDAKPIEFEYRMRTTQLVSGTVRPRTDDWSPWKAVSLTINPIPDPPLVHTISLSGEDSDRKAISEDENFKIRLVRGTGVAVNVSPTLRHYQAYFDPDVDETNDVAYEMRVVGIFRSTGPDGVAGTADDVPVIYDANGNDISATLPNLAAFTCDDDGICTGEFRAAANFFTNAGEDAFFQVSVNTCPRVDKLAGNCNPTTNPASLPSNPALPGRVSFTIASIDDAPTTGGAGIVPGIPEDENYVIVVKRNPAANELGYTEIEPGDRAEKLEVADITYYDPFYQSNENLTLGPYPNPVRDALGQILNFVYGPSNTLSGQHGFPFSSGETYAPDATAISRTNGNQRRLMVIGEYFAGGAGTGPSYVSEINLNNFLLSGDGTNPSRHQFVCRRSAGDGLQVGECRFMIRSPLHFNTDNPAMSGRKANMRYRVFTRDPLRWKEPTLPTSDESGGKWSDWRTVELLLSPVDDPPVLSSPLTNQMLTRNSLNGGTSGNNTTTNRVIWNEDQEGMVFFDWRNSYSDVDYNTESFTYEYDKATRGITPGNWVAGMFSNARSFLASKLAVNITSVKTIFHDTGYEAQPLIAFEYGGPPFYSGSYLSNTSQFLQTRERLTNPNAALQARTFGSAQVDSGLITLPVGGTFDFTHNLNRMFADLNFAICSEKLDPDACANPLTQRRPSLTNLELNNNFTLTPLDNNTVRVVRTGDTMLNGLPSPGSATPDYSFGNRILIAVSAAGWNQGTAGQYLGAPAADNLVSSNTNINCDTSNGECRLSLQLPPNFSGDVDAKVRIASGSQFPLTRNWNDELNEQSLFIRVRNVDDLPQIIVPEMTVDIFDGEFLDLRFGRLPRGLTSCSQIEGADGYIATVPPAGSGITRPVGVARRPSLTPGNPYPGCNPVGILRAVQDDWQTMTPPALPTRGCSALGAAGGPFGVSMTGPGEGTDGANVYKGYCAAGLWLYNFVDDDRKEVSEVRILNPVTTIAGLNGGNPLFELRSFTSAFDGPLTNDGTLLSSFPAVVPMGSDPRPDILPFIPVQSLRIRATARTGNAVFLPGATTGRPFDYLGGTDAGLGGLSFDYQIKTNNETAAITNTVDCSDPANCWSNTGRIYVRIHGNDDPLAAVNSTATTVRGNPINVTQVLTMDEDGGSLTLTVDPSKYTDPEANSAPFDKPIGIAMCSDLAVQTTSAATPGIQRWEDYDNYLFEWSPDFEYREAQQTVLTGGQSDTMANERSWLRYERYFDQGNDRIPPDATKFSTGNLILTAGTPQPFKPGRPGSVYDSRAYTGLTENNGLQSNCSLAGNTPTGTCSMQVRPQLNLNGEFLLCVQIRSFAKTGDRILNGLSWSDPIYYKIVINPVDDPPRLGQLSVRGRGNEDHLIPIEVRPQSFEWEKDERSTIGVHKNVITTGSEYVNTIYYYGREADDSGSDAARIWSKDRFTAIRPGYWDYDSNMGPGSPDLAEFLYINMASVAGDPATGIGSGAINHAANPDTAVADGDFDLPCSASNPIDNICVIKCRTDGVCPFRFQPPVHSDQNFKLQYWIKARGDKKLSTRQVDNTVAARGGDNSYAIYEDLGMYDNYAYHHCLPERHYDVDRWRYAQEEPKMTGTFDLAAVAPVTKYYGAPYYDQLSPPAATRSLLSFIGSNPLRVIVPMQKDNKLSSFGNPLSPVSPPMTGSSGWSHMINVGQGPGIPESVGANGANLVPALVGITALSTPAQVEAARLTAASGYVSGHNRALVGPGDPMDLDPKLFPAPTQRSKLARHYLSNTRWPGGPLRPHLADVTSKGPPAPEYPGPSYAYFHEELRTINRTQLQGPAPGVVPFIPVTPGWPHAGYYQIAGCNPMQTAFISIAVEPVPDKPQTPSAIARTISGRVANEIVFSNQEDPKLDGYTDGDGDPINGIGFLEVAGPTNWSITASPTAPATPVGLTLLERDPPVGPRADGARARYWLKQSGTNASGPLGCVSGAGLCRFYFHPGPGFSGNLPLDYIVRTGADNWESDDGVNPATCEGTALGLSCNEVAPGRLNLNVVSSDPVIVKLPGAEPYYVNEDGGTQQIMVAATTTAAQFNVDEGGGPEQDPERIVVTFSGCDEVVIKCANITYSRNDAAYGSTTSPANNMGAANGTISVTPEPDRFSTGPMVITMRASEVDASGVAIPGALVEVNLQIEVRPVEDAPTISSAPLTSPAYAGTEDTPLVINSVTIDEGGGVDEDSQAVVVTFDSSNKPVLPNANIVLSPGDESGGNSGNFGGTARTITLTPVANAFSPAGSPISVTMTVTDGVSAPVVRVFQVEFAAANDAPVLTSAVPILKGTATYSASQSTPLVITAITLDEGGNSTGVGNEDSQTVSVVFLSNRTDVINPATDVVLSGGVDTAGTDSNQISRTLTITPSGYNATAESTELTMRVSDGTATTDYILDINVARPPTGPITCDALPSNIVGAGQALPALTCSGLVAAPSPGTGTATYALDAASTCTSASIAVNGGSGGSMTLGGTMNTSGDCTVVVSGTDGGAPAQKVPPTQRFTQQFVMAKVTDITFGTPVMANTCQVSVPMTVTYLSGRSSYGSGGVAAGTGSTAALSGYGISSTSVTATLSDFTKSTDALDISVVDTKNSSLTKALSLNIGAALVQNLEPKDPTATVSGNRSVGQQIPIADGSICVNPSCQSETSAVIAAGPGTSCTLKSDGTLHCWGRNTTDGVLGSGSTVAGVTSSPLDIETLKSDANFSSIRSVAIGGAHSCAVTAAGKLWCWGSNSQGQLGQPLSTALSATPLETVSADVSAVAAGLNHTCYLKTDGKVFCVGDNTRGQLGDGTTADSDTWRDTGLSNAVAIAAAGETTCALTGAAGSRVLSCWGDDTTHQTGRSGVTGYSENPGAVDAISSSLAQNGVALAMGGASGKGQTCLLTRRDTAPIDAGTLRCFGDNAVGQLGQNPTGLATTGTAANSAVSPAFIAPVPALAGVAMGPEHTCAVTTTRALYCFGQRGDGRLGSGSTASGNVHVPTLVSGSAGSKTVAVSAGDAHTCAVTTDPTTGNRVLCFGRGTDGALGNNTTTSTETPADLWSNTPSFQPSARKCYGYTVTTP